MNKLLSTVFVSKGGFLYMARKREKRTMLHQVQAALDEKLRIGQSKHEAKKAGIAHEGIYSWSTYKNYLKHGNYFAQYCRHEHGCKTLAAARQYVDEYLQKLIDEGKSPYTQKLAASALAKVYGCRTTDFMATESRIRKDIKRSRGEKSRDVNFSEEKNAELVNFCRCTGLRRSELESLGSWQLHGGEKFGWKLEIIGKGGRKRLAPIVGSQEEIKAVIDRIQRSEGLVWGKVHNGADIHAYRAEYCTRIYKQHAREIKDIPYDAVNAGSGRKYQSEVYNCKGDLKGVKYDKAAMLIASKALGHNRISVIAEHYIRREELS